MDHHQEPDRPEGHGRVAPRASPNDADIEAEAQPGGEPTGRPVDGATGASVPERVCRRCSTVARTTGDFCPHCGASYVRRRRGPQFGRRAKRIILALLAVVLIGGIATGATLKVRADQRAEALGRAEARAKDSVRRERERRARNEAQAAAAEEEAAAEEGRLQRSIRTLTVRELRKAVTKDARDKHAQGLLEDRATSTSCENTEGTEDDFTVTTAEYSCIAVTEKDADGSSRGYRFTARVDFEDGSFTWHLGD